MDSTRTHPDLNAIPRAGPIGRGRAHLVAEGRADLHAKTFLASASVELAGLDVKGVQLARGVVTASAEGPLSSPRVVAKVLGVEVRAGGYAFPHLSATARGTPQSLDVSAELLGDDHAPAISARARVTHPGDLVVLGTRVQVAREDVKTTTTIASVRVAGGAVDVRGLNVVGLGDPIAATARISPSGVTVRTLAPDVDLGRVATLLAREEDARGHLSFDIDATARRQRRRRPRRTRRSTISRCGGVDGGSLRVAMSIEGTRLRGEVAANLGEVGKVEVSTTEVTLGGPATEPSAWRGATGALSRSTATWTSSSFWRRSRSGSRPVASAAGVRHPEGQGFAHAAPREPHRDARGVHQGPRPRRQAGEARRAPTAPSRSVRSPSPWPGSTAPSP